MRIAIFLLSQLAASTALSNELPLTKDILIEKWETGTRYQCVGSNNTSAGNNPNYRTTMTFDESNRKMHFANTEFGSCIIEAQPENGTELKPKRKVECHTGSNSLMLDTVHFSVVVSHTSKEPKFLFQGVCRPLDLR